MGAPPERGQSIVHNIPSDERGIRKFEVPQMVEYVKEFCYHPRVVKLARRIVSMCPAKDKLCEMNALFLWVKSHLRYTNDPVDNEVIATAPYHLDDMATPPEVIEAILGPEVIKAMDSLGFTPAKLHTNKIHCRVCFEEKLSGPHPTSSGDCDEGATLLNTLLAAVGIVPRFRFGGHVAPRSKDGCGYHHVWSQAQHGGQWIDMDVTEKNAKIGWYYPRFTCYGSAEIPGWS